MTLFSIVIPAFNAQSTIADSLESLLRQSLGDFEVVVVDDGSTDETRATVGSFRDPRIRLIPISHRGESPARNVGIAEARGDFVMFLDSDDQLLPLCLESMERAIAPDMVVVRCGSVQIAPDGSAHHVFIPKTARAIGSWLTGFIAGTYAVRRDVMVAVGGISDVLTFGQHTELAIRLWPAVGEGEAAIAPIVGLRRVWSGGDAKYGIAFTQGINYIMRQHASALRRERRLRQASLATAGVAAVRAGYVREARSAFARAVIARPTPKGLARLAAAMSPPFARAIWSCRPLPSPPQGAAADMR
jgi:glycosyltransferase involved in cell wall biosynthesis